MMKRISCGILALILTAALFCGCGEQQKEKQKISGEEVRTITPNMLQRSRMI